MASVGRKLKLTKELADIICSHIATGNYNVVVCGLVGVDESTFYRWLEYGQKENEKEIYKEFYKSIKKAEAEREAKWVKDIDSDSSWIAKAWLLERKYPDRWARKDFMNHTVSGNITLIASNEFKPNVKGVNKQIEGKDEDDE